MIEMEPYQEGFDEYYTGNGLVLKREYQTLTPNGNSMSGRWVLRDAEGKLIDFDKYRNSIAERNDLKLYY